MTTTAPPTIAPPSRRSFLLGAAAFDTLVFAYAFTVPLEEVSIPGLGRLPMLAGLLLGGVAVLRILGNARVFRLNLAWPMLALLYLGVVMASQWWTVDPEITLTRTRTLVNLVAVVLIIVGEGTRRTLVAGVLGLAGGSTVLGVSSLVDYTESVRTDAAEVRVTAYSLDPNDAAAMMVVATVALLAIGLGTHRRRLSWPLFALAAFLAGCAMLTASRTGMVALLAGAGVVVWQARHRLRSVLILAALVVPVAWAALAVLDPRISGRLAGTDEAVGSGNFNQRQYLWTAAVDAWSERPLLGWGAGAERLAMEEYSSFSLVTHNTWLGALTETGLVGGILLVALWLLALPRRGMPRFERAVVWSMLVPLLIATFTLSLGYRKILWLVLALCVLAGTRREWVTPSAVPPPGLGPGVPARVSATAGRPPEGPRPSDAP